MPLRSPLTSAELRRQRGRLASAGLQWLYQATALTRKTFILLSKQLRVSLLLLTLPLLSLGLVLVLRAIYTPLVTINSAHYNVDHSPFSPQVAPCTQINALYTVDPSAPCVSLTYAPSLPWTDAIMAQVAAGLPQLTLGVDIIGYRDNSTLLLDWASHLGRRDMAILFQPLWVGPSAQPAPPPQPGALQQAYLLYYNASSNVDSNSFSGYYGYWTASSTVYRVAAVQFLLEAALANALALNISRAYPPLSSSAPSPLPSLNVSASVGLTAGAVAQLSDLQVQYIQLLQSDDRYASLYLTDALPGVLGGPLFVLSATIACLLLIQMVASEKQGQLLAMMRMSRLKESAYWASYLVAFALLALPASLLATALGVGSGLTIYAHVDFGIHFIGLWLLLLSMSSVALLVAALWTQPRWVNLFSFLLLALCLLSTVYLNANAYYNISQPSGSTLLTSLAPWFHYGRVWSDTIRHSQLTYTVNVTAQQEWLAANRNATRSTPYPLPMDIRLPVQVQQSFSWAQTYERQLIVSPGYTSLCLPFDAVCCDYYNTQYPACYYAHSTQYSFGLMLALTAGYTLLAWWLSQTTNQLGGGKPWYFPLRPAYWMETRRHATKVLRRTGKEGEEEEEEGAGDAQALADERDLFDRELRLSAEEGSVRTLKLSKAYKRVSAVKELTLHMARGEVFCLLGGNGAGKSTVVNVLSGLLRPTFGEAFICGYSVREDLAHVQELISVCHQDNVLWPQLTVQQHLQLQCALRCLRPELIPDTTERLLRLVSLWLHRRKRSDELSGGMKRRLCLALTLVGDPAVVLLDECCSGLDPMHKVEVWDVIQRLKQGRVVLLTTHSMAEAEYLGDQVALLADGRLTAVGSPQFLKDHFGMGYQLQLLVQPAHVQQVVRAIRRHISHSEVLGTEGGSICVAVKRQQLPEVLRFITWAQSHRPTLPFDQPPHLPSSSSGALSPTHAQLVREWSLTQSTLEEIFLRFCARQHTVNAADLLVDSNRQGDVGEEKGGAAEQRVSSGFDSSSPSSVAHVSGVDDDAVPQYVSSSWVQVRSVLLKNWAMMRSEKRSWLARVLVLVAVLALLIYLVLNARRSDLCPQGYQSNPIYSPCDAPSLVDALFDPRTSRTLGVTQLDAVVDLSGFNQSSYRTPTWSSYQSAGYSPGLTYVYTGAALDALDLGQGLLGVLNVSAIQAWPSRSTQPSNFSALAFVDYTGLMASDGAADLSAQLVLNQQLVLSHLNDTPMSERLGPCSSSQTPYGGVVLPSWYLNDSAQAQALGAWLYPNGGGLQMLGDGVVGVNASHLSYRYVQWTFELLYEPPAISYPFEESPGQPIQCQSVSPLGGLNQNINPLIHGLSHALLYTTVHRTSSYVQTQAAANPAGNPWRNVSAPLISGTLLALQGPNFPGAIDQLTLAECIALMTFIMSLLLPWYSDRVLYEREQRLFFMMRLAGLRPANYWLGNYLFDLSVAWVWNVSVVVLGYAMGLGLFVGSDLVLWLVLLLVWTHVQVGLSWCVAALFSRRTLASIALHVLVVVLVLYAFVMENLRYFSGQRSFTYPTWLLLFPPFAFVRCLSLIIQDSGGLGALAAGTDLSLALLALLLIGTGFMFIGWLLHTLQYRSLRSLLEQLPCYRGPRWHDKRTQQAEVVRRRLSVANQTLLSPASHAAMQREEEEEGEGEVKVDSDASIAPQLGEDLRAEMDRVSLLMSAGVGGGEERGATGVCISGLSKTYDKVGLMRSLRRLLCLTNDDDRARVVDAVHELSLVVEYGECFGLLGPNGAGPHTHPHHSLRAHRRPSVPLLCYSLPCCCCVRRVCGHRQVDAAVDPLRPVQSERWPRVHQRARRAVRAARRVLVCRNLSPARPAVRRPDHASAPAVLRAPEGGAPSGGARGGVSAGAAGAAGRGRVRPKGAAPQRGHEATPVHRHQPGGQPAGVAAGRAQHRPVSRRAALGVADRQRADRQAALHAGHYASDARGRHPVLTRRRHVPRAATVHRHPGAAQAPLRAPAHPLPYRQRRPPAGGRPQHGPHSAPLRPQPRTDGQRHRAGAAPLRDGARGAGRASARGAWAAHAAVSVTE